MNLLWTVFDWYREFDAPVTNNMEHLCNVGLVKTDLWNCFSIIIVLDLWPDV